MRTILRHIFQRVAPKVLCDVSCLTFLSNRGLLGKNTYYDSLTALIFKKHLNRDSVCVDVGCHKGDILKLMMRHAPEGKFFAFEPIPALYEALREKFKDDPRVSVFNTALSNQAGESSFNYVISHPAFSGLIKRTYYFPNQNDTRITVKTDRLDNIVKDSTVDMIKIDVEGAELQVLQGAKKTLQRDRPVIIFEHGMGAADCYDTKPEDIFALLCDDCGLRINLLHRFLKRQAPLQQAEFCEQFYKGLNFYFVAHAA